MTNKKHNKAQQKAIDAYKAGDSLIDAYQSAFPLSKNWKIKTVESKAQRLFDLVDAKQGKKKKKPAHVKSNVSTDAKKQTKDTATQKSIKYELSEEQKYLFSKCTKLQQRVFINVTQGNMSNRQAYLDAGGKATSDESVDAAVSVMLRNDKVRALYDSLTHEKLNDAIMMRDEALEILTSVSRSSVDDEEDFKFKVQPKLAAIKQMSTMQGWESAQKYEHTGKDGKDLVVSDADLARKLAFLLTKGDEKP